MSPVHKNQSEIITCKARSNSSSSEPYRKSFKEVDQEEGCDDITEDDEDGELQQVPDGGWGWMVVIGSTVVTCLTCMVGSCFGILYSEALAEMGATSSVVAWIFNIYQLIINISGLLIGPLKEEFGFRKISIFGSLIASVSIIASSMANSPLILLITFSISTGIGVGLAVNVGYIIPPFYFKRYLGIANAFTMAGVCSSQFIGPPLIGYLINEYSSKGAALIFGGLILNAAALSVVFHPVEWHMKKIDEIENKESEEHSNENQKNKFRVSIASISPKSEVEETDWAAVIEMAKNKRMIQAKRESISLVKSYTRISFTHSNADLGGLSAVASFAAMPQVLDEERMEQEHFYLTSTPPNESRGFIHTFIRLMNTTIKNLKILKSPRGIIIAFGSSCVINGYSNSMMLIPFALQAQGHELETAAWILSIGGITNFITRLILSLLSGYSWFHKRICYMAGSIILSASIMCFTWSSNILWIAMCMILWGIGVGSCMCLHNLNMVEYMGVENLPAMFGATALIIALGFLVLGPIAGLIRDVTGDYNASFYFLAGICLISPVLYLFMPSAVAYDKNKQNRKKRNNNRNET